MNETRKPEGDPLLERRLLALAHVFALGAYALTLAFLLQSTGATVFLFTTVVPVLVLGSVIIFAAVMTNRFLRRHSLFNYHIYQPGEIIFQQGDEGDCAYFIQTGEVEILQKDHVAEKSLATLKPGQYFGEMALIQSQPRNATARAVITTKIASLGKKNFLTLLNVIPETRQDVMLTVVQRGMKQSAGK
jgi:CRP-like cAMP-binding protein